MIRIIIFVVFFSVLFFSDANAAEFSRPKTKNCDLALRGDIEEGDTERLKKALDSARLEERGASKTSRTLCLHSPRGGQFSEAVRIARWLVEEKNIYTLVDKGDVCVSACALIFMFGNHWEGHAYNSSRRSLHVLGKLGFHTPHINPILDAKDIEIAAKAYREGIKAIGELLQLDWDDWFPKTLLVEMLRHEAHELLFVDDIKKAAAWGIDLIGWRVPKPITKVMLEQSCINNARIARNKWSGRWWGSGDSPTGQREEILSKPTPILMTKKHQREIFEGFGDEDSFICVADVYLNAGDFEVDISYGSDLRDPAIPRPNSRNIGIPLWYLYKGDTLLNSIAE